METFDNQGMVRPKYNIDKNKKYRHIDIQTNRSIHVYGRKTDMHTDTRYGYGRPLVQKPSFSAENRPEHQVFHFEKRCSNEC